MPIKFTFKKVPIDEAGIAYPSLEAFQRAQIAELFEPKTDPCGYSAEDSARLVVENKDAILEILNLTMDARPTARGIKKPRKAKLSDHTIAFNLAANAAK